MFVDLRHRIESLLTVKLDPGGCHIGASLQLAFDENEGKPHRSYIETCKHESMTDQISLNDGQREVSCYFGGCA